MESTDSNNNTLPDIEQAPSTPIYMRDKFCEWLSGGNSKKFTPEVSVACLDKISEYAKNKKICYCSLWEISKHSQFKPIYQKIMDAKLLRIMERNTYKVFTVAGQLYMKFLAEKPWETGIAVASDMQIKDSTEVHAEAMVSDVVLLEDNNSPEVSSLANIVFRKEVDWSLLHYGFTIPRMCVDVFCSNIEEDIPHGGSRQITIVINKHAYEAILSNVGFSSDKRSQLQVRYSASSPAAVSLRNSFKESYDYLNAKRSNEAGSAPFYGKEYVDVVCISPNTYGLICYSENQDISEIVGSDEDDLNEINASSVAQNSDVKVGLYIRNKLRQLSDSGFGFSEHQLQNIFDLQWGKATLKLATPNPFAKLVDGSVSVVDLAKDESGYNRYWNEVFIFGEIRLIFTSQWYERNRSYFDEWLISLNIDISFVAPTIKVNTHQKSGGSNKYSVLKCWLIENGNDSIHASFSEIAELVGGLPPSAYEHRAFWANSDRNSFAASWLAAGYKTARCDLQSKFVLFVKSNVKNDYNQARIITVKEALIEFSNNYKGLHKSRKEMVQELSTKYGHNKHSILPADYEVDLNNSNPKLFKRVDHGRYLCLGCDSYQSSIMSSINDSDSAFGLISDDDKKKMLLVIASRFRNGFRTSSNIDFERFANYYDNEYNENFQYTPETLDEVLSSEALIFDDRAYVFNDEVKESVCLLLEQTGSLCICIDIFFNKYSNDFYLFNIFSIEMLRAFMEKNYTDIYVRWDYILMQEKTTPSDIIKEVFNEREVWSFDELQERLPYFRMDTIRQILNSAEYFRIDKGTYTHIANIDLPDEEGEKILSFVENKLHERDYVIANELDMSKFENLNPHCSFAAVRDAVFYKFLSGNYIKRGQVITRSGDKLRVLDIMEQYCRDADTVTFEELNAFEATFDPEGRTHSQCLIAGHNTMVRVSSELFVSDSNVDFDVTKIDEAIALYCHGSFMPLRVVTDFSLFPYVGYPWNLYLLESYVRRFSRVFKYDVRAVNSANIGTIVRKSFDYHDYDYILALALAKSSVSLSDKKAVGDYLFENGYIGWRNLGKNESNIIKSAKALREGGML